VSLLVTIKEALRLRLRFVSKEVGWATGWLEIPVRGSPGNFLVAAFSVRGSRFKGGFADHGGRNRSIDGLFIFASIAGQ
jgi:hypothetical protein